MWVPISKVNEDQKEVHFNLLRANIITSGMHLKLGLNLRRYCN